MKSLVNIKSPLFIFSIGVIIVLVTLFALKNYLQIKKPTVLVPNMNYVLSPDKVTISVGEKLTIPVYLTGTGTDGVTAYDIKFYYDRSKLRLNSTKPGNFFEKYMTIKWDQENAWYALAMSPGKPKQPANTSSPLLVLEFTALTKSDSAEVKTDTSMVYVSQTGGFRPKAGIVELRIK